MSAYNARRAPNVSEFIQQLNNITPPEDLKPADEFLNLPDDMALFTTTEFNDADFFHIGGLEQPEADGARPPSSAFDAFSFPDFSAFQTISIKPAPPQDYAANPLSSPTTASPLLATLAPNSGDKRKADYLSDPSASEQPMESESRIAAEEDKRRRNTAASARFRIKKKQREQALEAAAKEMTDRVAALEAENQQLKMENKWLKGIIVDKADKVTVEAVGRGDGKAVEKRKLKEEAWEEGLGTGTETVA